MQGPRARRTVARAERAITALSNVLSDLVAGQERIRSALIDTGIRPFGQPRDGFRWKTPDEYRAEFLDQATTPARRQQLFAIRAGFLPPEDVALPIVPVVPSGQQAI